MTNPSSINRVVMIFFENHNLNQILSNGPYFKELWQRFSSATRSKEPCNPSLPNYLGWTCGSTQNKCGTDDMTGLPIDTNNIYRLVKDIGITFGNWAEKGSVPRHTPAEFYTNTVGTVKDFSDWQSRFLNGNEIPPNFCCITPSNCSDSHDCSISVADNWLKNIFNLPELMNKSWYKETCFAILFDEGYGEPRYEVYVSELSTPPNNYTNNSTNWNTLSTIEWLLGLGNCGNNDKDAPPMKSLFEIPPPAKLTAHLLIKPGTIKVRDSVTFDIVVSGGTPPYAYTWKGLPTNCKVVTDETLITCNPDNPGIYNISVCINDSKNDTVIASATLIVEEVKDQCNENLWNHVYNPERLKIIKRCVTVTGTIKYTRPSKDGDLHIRLKLDKQYENMLNDKNIEKQDGCLVVEVMCVEQSTTKDCKGFTQKDLLKDVKVGNYISVTGSFVEDTNHGWNEIHPVTSIKIMEKEKRYNISDTIQIQQRPDGEFTEEEIYNEIKNRLNISKK